MLIIILTKAKILNYYYYYYYYYYYFVCLCGTIVHVIVLHDFIQTNILPTFTKFLKITCSPYISSRIIRIISL